MQSSDFTVFKMFSCLRFHLCPCPSSVTASRLGNPAGQSQLVAWYFWGQGSITLVGSPSPMGESLCLVVRATCLPACLTLLPFWITYSTSGMLGFFTCFDMFLCMLFPSAWTLFLLYAHSLTLTALLCNVTPSPPSGPMCLSPSPWVKGSGDVPFFFVIPGF